MLRRGLAFCVVLAMGSVAHAGAIVSLVPQTAGPYMPDQLVDVDVLLSQNPAGTDRELRHVQLDFEASDDALTLIPPLTHNLEGTDVRFWDFTDEPACTNGDEETCGAGHFFDSQFTAPADRREVVSMTYYFQDAGDLNENPDVQRTLPASDQIRIGVIQVRMPSDDTPACYSLDALNSAQSNPDLGGAGIRFGFGTDVDPNAVPLTTWRVGQSAPNDITGSSIDLCIGDGGDPCTINLASSAPADQGSLWRSARNIIRLTFDGALPGLPPAGAVKVRKMVGDGSGTPCGSFEEDLSSGFTFELEDGDTVLKIRETSTAGGPLQHRMWYHVAVLEDGDWPGVCPFSRQYVVQVGDQDANRFVTAIDVGNINASATGLVADDSRNDIDGNGFRTSIDVGVANASQGPLPPKPCGH